MKQSKSIYFSILISIFFIFSIYFSGCTSAELTTGKLAFQQKEFVKAEGELKKGLAVDAADDQGWYMLGYSQIENGHFDDAKISFKKTLSLSNNYSEYIKVYWVDKFNAGINSFNSGTKSLGRKDSITATKNFNEALGLFKATTCIIPDSINGYQMMGDCYTYLGKPDEALAIYTSILDRSKSKSDAIMITKILYMSGMKSREAEQWEKAIEVFKKATEVPFIPKDNVYYENSLFNLGFCNYQIASKIATENKGDFKPYLNEVVKILEPLSLATKDNGILSNVYDILNSAYDALGMTDKAAEVLKKKQDLPKK